jgi:hypothetical protein
VYLLYILYSPFALCPMSQSHHRGGYLFFYHYSNFSDLHPFNQIFTKVYVNARFKVN